jgi:hypothetical protein
LCSYFRYDGSFYTRNKCLCAYHHVCLLPWIKLQANNRNFDKVEAADHYNSNIPARLDTWSLLCCNTVIRLPCLATVLPSNTQHYDFDISFLKVLQKLIFQEKSCITTDFFFTFLLKHKIQRKLII